MGNVRVIAPDGSSGSMPEEDFEAAKADGFRLADGGAAAPVAAPAADAGRTIRVRAPDGSVGTMPAADFEEAKNDGFERLDLSAGGQARAGLEGAARGATLGASDVVQTAGAGLGTGLGNKLYDLIHGETPRTTRPGIDAPLAPERPLYDREASAASGRELEQRREDYRGTAIAGEIAGAVGASLLSGGQSGAALAARYTPAGQLAHLATKMGSSLMAGAAKNGLGAAGRIGALVATGAVEGAVDNATRTVMHELSSGQVDLSAERMGKAAWDAVVDGALVGGGTGGLIGAGAEAVSAAGRGVRALVDKAAPYIAQTAGERAFKAVMGGANLKGVRKAYKYFDSPENVGNTLLKEGVVTREATLETMAERASDARTSLGKQLGAKVREADELSGGTGLSREALKQKLYDDVITPLKQSPINRDLGQRIENEMGGLIDELSPSPVSVRTKGGAERPLNRDALTFEQADTWRKELDQRINWEKVAPDVATEQRQRIRGAMTEFWMDAADQAADRASRPGFADEIRALKQRYSHIALADDLAADGVAKQLSNRFVSPTDYLAGGAGTAAALATGGTSLGALAMGAGASMANKVIRERGNQFVADTLYRLAQRGVKTEEALESAVTRTLSNVALPASSRVANDVAPTAVEAAADISRMVAQARAVQDPNSPEAAALDATTMQLAGDSPIFANAIKQQVLKQAAMITRQIGPDTDPNDPLQSAPRMVDPIKQGRNERFMRAIQDPSAALDRLVDGSGGAEDLAVVREMTPLVHRQYVDRVMERLIGSGTKLGPEQRARLHYVVGRPVSALQTPAYIQYFQKLHQNRRNVLGEPSQPSNARPTGMPNNTQDGDLDATSNLARADQVLAGVGAQ